jgi:hypothetical protein
MACPGASAIVSLLRRWGDYRAKGSTTAPRGRLPRHGRRLPRQGRRLPRQGGVVPLAAWRCSPYKRHKRLWVWWLRRGTTAPRARDPLGDVAKRPPPGAPRPGAGHARGAAVRHRPGKCAEKVVILTTFSVAARTRQRHRPAAPTRKRSVAGARALPGGRRPGRAPPKRDNRCRSALVSVLPAASITAASRLPALVASAHFRTLPACHLPGDG